MRLLDAERDNVLAALRHLVDIGERQRGLDLACRLGWYWMFTGAQAEAAVWLRFVLDGAVDVDPDAVLLAESMATITSDFEAATDDEVAQGFARLRAMLPRFEAADVERYPMLALMRPLMAMFASDDDALMVDAVDAARRNPEPWVAASAEMVAANIAENNGDMVGMRASAAVARAAFERLGERWGLASCLHVVGQLQTMDGDLDEALATYEEALRLVDELGAHDDAAWLRLRLADVLVRQGDLAGATEQAERAKELSDASGSLREAIFGRVITADIARRAGDLGTARRLLRESLDRIAAMPQMHPMTSHGLAVGLAIAARHYLLDGDLGESGRYLERSYEKALGTRDMPIIATVGAISAVRAEVLGRPEDAAERLGAAARLRGSADHTQPDIAELSARLRDQLGYAPFEAAFETGRALGRDDAIARLAPG
jgi:ATP/maltotriose-dependent transcriptional regulator MalT